MTALQPQPWSRPRVVHCQDFVKWTITLKIGFLISRLPLTEATKLVFHKFLIPRTWLTRCVNKCLISFFGSKITYFVTRMSNTSGSWPGWLNFSGFRTKFLPEKGFKCTVFWEKLKLAKR
jgi:hypothetical protein